MARMFRAPQREIRRLSSEPDQGLRGPRRRQHVGLTRESKVILVFCAVMILAAAAVAWAFGLRIIPQY